jgi:glycosyltransferase involved in cell wall biosynthesis
VPEKVSSLPRPLVVTAGRLVPWKNIDGIIDAIFLQAGPSLVVVGDGPLRVPLVHHANKKMAGQAVFTGLLSHGDTLSVMKAADVFILNSSYEGLSHLLIEALMLGVPIIATRVGGNPEVIQDGENGLLVPVGDTKALSSALERILTDTDLRKRLSEGAHDSIKRFSVETMFTSIVTALQAL